MDEHRRLDYRSLCLDFRVFGEHEGGGLQPCKELAAFGPFFVVVFFCEALQEQKEKTVGVRSRGSWYFLTYYSCTDNPLTGPLSAQS